MIILVEYLYHVNGKENVVFKETLADLTDNPKTILEDFTVKSNPKNLLYDSVL